MDHVYLSTTMQYRIRSIFYPVLIFQLSIAFATSAQSTQLLWYDQPAHYFEESLPLGNGKAGACVFGGVKADKIFLNDLTLWSGEPVDPNMNPDAHKHI